MKETSWPRVYSTVVSKAMDPGRTAMVCWAVIVASADPRQRSTPVVYVIVSTNTRVEAAGLKKEFAIF